LNRSSSLNKISIVLIGRNRRRGQKTPQDASWGERYFHISDPDGHELSFPHPI
jgi:hypothetical protein